MIVIVSSLSFILDGILSRYLYSSTFFLPLFTIVSLIIIYPYFNNHYDKYFRYLMIIGSLYDIVYFNTLFYNFFLFILIGFIVGFINYLLSNNLYTNILITSVSIVFYRFATYIFMVIFKNFNFDINILIKSIYSSLILNIIYCIIIYLITEIYSKKHKIVRRV